jgi:glycosyltransferase involved in cell wall biosynthesis
MCEFSSINGSSTRPPADITIGVVVPLYNKGDTVVRAIQSVLRQSYPASQIVVVDDGSNDCGGSLVKQLCNPHIRVIEQPNTGVSAARNRGIAETQARLVAFLDADDEWLPSHLQSIAALHARCPDSDVLASGYLIRTGSGVDRSPVLGRSDLIDSSGRVVDYFMLASRSDPPIWSSAVAVTKNALDVIGGFPTGIAQGEDLLTWARLAARFNVAIGPAPTAIFWQPEFDSGRPTRRPEAEDRVAPALVELLPTVQEEHRQSLHAYIAQWHKMRGSMFLALGDRRSALREFKLSRRHAFNRTVLIKTCMTLLPVGVVNRATEAWRAATRKPLKPRAIPAGGSR